MKLYKGTLKRAGIALLIAAGLLSAGITTANAQGKGRGRGVSLGGRPEIVVPMQRRERPVSREMAKPIPGTKAVKVANRAKPAKPAKLAKRAKPAKPAKAARHDKRAHKSCSKACKQEHKAAIRACRGRTGADRAACERAANEAHRHCMQGCPR